MKISKIKVKNYGPIKEFSAQCGKIEIFYGRNEAGKTALVDAITTALFKRRDIFSHQDRFEGKNFEVRVENKGEEYSFPGKKKFSEITNLPHYQLARLFIVRAGELTLREDEKWWDSVKEFLSGISVKINRLIEKINDRVGITTSGDWSNRHPDYIKTEIEKMETRKKELEISIGNLKQIQDKEKELEKKQKEKASLKKKLEDFYRYQEYLRYEQANKAYEEYKRQKQILLDYQRYRREDLDKWREKEGREKDIEREKLILQQNMENLKKEIKDDQGEENRLIKKHQELIQKRNRANLFSINDKFFRFKVQSEALNSKKLKKFLWVGEGLFSVGAIFLLLSVFFIFFFYLGWLILAGAGVFLFLYANLQRRKNKLKREEKEILKVSRNIWEDCQDVWSIPSLWEKFQNSLSVLQGRLSKIREEKDKKIKKLKEIQDNSEFIALAQKNQQIREADLQSTYKALIAHADGLCETAENRCPLLVAIHTEGSNAAIAINFWQEAAKLGWLVAAPQSHQALWKDAYLWINRKLAIEEINYQIKSVKEKYAVDESLVVLAGRATSVPIAMEIAFKHPNGVLGFIAYDPPNLNRELDEWEPIINQISPGAIKGYFILHNEENRRHIEDISKLADSLTSANIWTEIEIVPGKPDLTSPIHRPSLSRALTFLAGG